MNGYDLSNLDVIVVDDCAQMRLILDTMLRTLKVGKLRVYSNGVEAFESFRSLPSDIVITDWVMKPITGLELVDKIRSGPATEEPNTPVIMVTSNSLSDEVSAARDAGVDAYLVKPIRTQNVYERIVQVIDRRIAGVVD